MGNPSSALYGLNAPNSLDQVSKVPPCHGTKKTANILYPLVNDNTVHDNGLYLSRLRTPQDPGIYNHIHNTSHFILIGLDLRHLS